MMNESSDKKILWAVDPFPEDLDVQRPMVQSLAALGEAIKSGIEPACVLVRRDAADTPEEPEEKELEEVLKVEKWLAGLPLKNCAPLKKLWLEATSPYSSEELILQYAKEQQADMIAVASHGRSGVDRIFLGSFTENLLLKSNLPVFVSNPTIFHSHKMEKILFPTDFSPSSWDAFTMAVELTKQMSARLVLFHELPNLPYYDPTLYVTPELKPQPWKEAQAHADRWVSWAEARNVQVVARIETQGRPASEAVLAFAHTTGAALIVMAHKAGAIRSAVLGSVTREVLRQSDCPVLVFRPDKEASEKEPKEDVPRASTRYGS